MTSPRFAIGLGIAALFVHGIGAWRLREAWISGFETRALSEPAAIESSVMILLATGLLGAALALAASYTAFRARWPGWGRYALVVGVCAPAFMVAITYLWATAIFSAKL
jgi:hypothetical protein